MDNFSRGCGLDILRAPDITAVIAGADGGVHYVVDGGLRAAGPADVLLPPADMEDGAEGEEQDPDEQIYYLPPPADEQPPEQAVAFFLSLCL